MMVAAGWDHEPEFAGPPCPEDVPFMCASACQSFALSCGGCMGCDVLTDHRCHKTGRVKHCEQADCDAVNNCHTCPAQQTLRFALLDDPIIEADEEGPELDEAWARYDHLVMSCPGASEDRCAGGPAA